MQSPSHATKTRRALAFTATLGAVSCAFASCSPSRFDGLTGGSRAPRLVHPLSGSYVFTKKPTLTWALPADVHRAVLEICEDSTCSSVVASKAIEGTSGAIDIDIESLEPGDFDREDPYWWRVRADGPSGVASAPWLMIVVPVREKDQAWGCVSDPNIDGLVDVIAGKPAENVLVLAPNNPEVRAGLSPQDCAPPVKPQELGLPGNIFNFGAHVAIAGDVNGDGFIDVLATTSTGSGTAAQVFAFFGRPGAELLTRTGDHELLPPAGAPATFGTSIAGVGDVDRDGYADVVVGDLTGVTIYWGSPNGPEKPTRITMGDVSDFGCAVSSAGDLDGDGFADFAVGAGCSEDGRAFAVFGGKQRTGLAPIEIPRPDGAKGFGGVLGLAGDLDADGKAELFVGAAVTGHGYVYGATEGRFIVLRRTFTADTPGFGAAVATDETLRTFWILARGNDQTTGALYFADLGDPPERWDDGDPGVLAFKGRFVDVGPLGGPLSVLRPVVSFADPAGSSTALRGACATGDAGADDGIETFLTSKGDIVFAK